MALRSFTPGLASDSLAVEIGNSQVTLVDDGHRGPRNRAAADKAVAANVAGLVRSRGLTETSACSEPREEAGA